MGGAIRGHWTSSGSGAGAGGCGAASMAPPLRRALWAWQRQQAAYCRRYTQGTTLIGREVELLEAMQLVSAMAGLAPPEKPGVPDDATRRPSGPDFTGARRVPLLLMAAEGAGKTHLVVRLLQQLGDEAPQLRVAAHFAAAGGCGFHLARVALSHLALQLHSLLLAEAAEAEAAATAATAADTAAAVAAATASVPARLPAAYAELSALCNRLMCASATSS